MNTGGHEANEHPEPADLATVLDAVRQAAQELLESLPGRPERLLVCAADVTIDVDWRSPGATGALPPAVSVPAVVIDLRPEPHYVCAPSVGVFYHCPAPGAAPFVGAGSTVGLGQQIGIVEAMKLLLPVETDRAGRVVEVLVADGQSVEYGERLVAIELGGANGH